MCQFVLLEYRYPDENDKNRCSVSIVSLNQINCNTIHSLVYILQTPNQSADITKMSLTDFDNIKVYLSPPASVPLVTSRRNDIEINWRVFVIFSDFFIVL